VIILFLARTFELLINPSSAFDRECAWDPMETDDRGFFVHPGVSFVGNDPIPRGGHQLSTKLWALQGKVDEMHAEVFGM